jgi:predicted phosphodiesterase
MRVAVMSDIHGFSIALETVLSDIDATGPYDEIVVAGDLCAVGPDPDGVLEMLRGRTFTILQGNTDYDVVDTARFGPFEEELSYVQRKIGPEGIEYLAMLPFSHRVTPPDGSAPDDDLLVVHANPHNLLDKLDPNDSDRALREIIGEARFRALAFGHIHICYTRELDGRLLIDVSAVGNSKDRDLRCKYGVLTWNAETRAWTAEIRKLDYPLAETEAQILASDLPNPKKTLKKLIEASY